METELKAVPDRALTWPQERQQELAQLALDQNCHTGAGRYPQFNRTNR